MGLVQMPEVGSALIESATVGVPAGLICGAGGAMLLGRLDWRGSVVAPAAIAALAVVPFFGPALWALAAVLLCGGLREHWRAEDIKKGQDKARRARQATGLVALIRNASERRRLVQGRYRMPDSYPVGTDETGAVSCLPLGLTEGRHALVIGATGSGKTTTLLTASTAHVDAGCGLVVIDPKGDPALADRLRDLAARAGRDFEHFALAGDSHRWNPLGRGTPSERSDKLIAAEDWTEPHYKRLYQRYLLTLFTAVEARGETPYIGMVVDLLRPERLTVYARDIDDATIAERIDRHLADLTDREVRDLAGLRNRIALLSESEFGHLLAPNEDGRQEIDLLRSITVGSVVVFSLSTSRYPETSKLLGSALFQDLKNVAGVLEESIDKRAAAVVVDERLRRRQRRRTVSARSIRRPLAISRDPGACRSPPRRRGLPRPDPRQCRNRHRAPPERARQRRASRTARRHPKRLDPHLPNRQAASVPRRLAVDARDQAARTRVLRHSRHDQAARRWTSSRRQEEPPLRLDGPDPTSQFTQANDLTRLNAMPHTPPASTEVDGQLDRSVLAEPLLDARDAASLLTVRPSWIYDAARSGALPHIKIGRHLRFLRSDLERWVLEQRLGA
jgi:excisionase family DNA binding protein